VFWRWILFAIWHGGVAFMIPMYSTRGIVDDAKSSEHWYSSTIVFSVLVHLVTIKLFIESIFWNWLSILMACFSLSIYYLILIIISTEIFSTNFQAQATGLIAQEFGSLYFWIIVSVVPFVCLLPDLSYKFISNLYWPSPADIICAEQKGIREKVHEKAMARARKKNSKLAYQDTNKNRKGLLNGEDSDDMLESEEEEEEEESKSYWLSICVNVI
jgi:magnesium-transporting ATPase (P-type)